MQLNKTKGGSVSATGYEPKGKQMQIMFANLSLYQYENISQAEYDSVVNAKPVGSKLREVVKGKNYKKL
jgi:hypothetical protein